MILSVSLSLSVDTAPTAGQSPAAKPVKTESSRAIMCFFLLLKFLQNQNLEILHHPMRLYRRTPFCWKGKWVLIRCLQRKVQ